MDGAPGMGNAGLGSNLVLEFHVAGERLESLRSHHCCGWLWNAKLTGIGGAHARPGSSALELQRNAIAFLDTGHRTRLDGATLRTLVTIPSGCLSFRSTC